MRNLPAAALALVLLTGGNARAVVSEDSLPQAQWISATPSAEAAQTAFFRKSFTAPPTLIKAVLLAACDERATLFVNGAQAAQFSGFDKAASIDVTQHLRAGQNLLAVQVENSRGLAALRLMLELATESGRQSWIITDGSWNTATEHITGWNQLEFRGSLAAAVAHGAAGLTRWGDAFHATKSVDAYNSWMLARGAAQATPADGVNAPPGFRVELLRSALPEEGSWIALAFDPQGRLTISREKRGLLRMTLGEAAVEKVELIEDTLLECRGILYAHEALYAHANNSKGFYRLRDTTGDDQFDEVKLLLKTGGSVGHGRNHLRLGPDGLIYLACGNDVELPESFSPDSPLRHSAADQLFPLRWGEHGSSDYVQPPHGYMLQTDRDGSFFRVLAGGLRNQLDLDFNEDGEMFTYDADNERDIATPWYLPTRVLHIVSGGEYGWRIGAGKLPQYLPDAVPSVVDIGVGSPCGVEFGTLSKFPAKWRRALFIADWAYGRIVAVHIEPHGSSYRGVSEPFVTGRPLNVTDMTMGADGALYFTTGGRGTQSGLYRVSYTGEISDEKAPAPDPRHAQLRSLRKQLEALHGRVREGAVDKAWPHLAHEDRFIRFAARVAVEAQPLDHWQEKALEEKDAATALGALLALSRVAPAPVHPRLLLRLQELPLAAMTHEQQLAAIRVAQLSCARAGMPAAMLAVSLAKHFDAIYPAQTQPLNHELCRLLVFLQSARVLEKTSALLTAARTSEDLLHYLWHLRHVRDGWTIDQRRAAFTALRRAEQLQGAREYLQALRDLRRDFTAALSEDERGQLAGMLSPAEPDFVAPVIDFSKYRFHQQWTLQDFTAEDFAQQTNPGAGREPYAAAQCIQCHRTGQEPGGALGPDLSEVAARFNRRDLLQHILEPSLAIDDKYRNLIVTLKDGATYSGAFESEDEERLALSTGASLDDVIYISKAEISAREISPDSPMPAGLLNILSKEQVLDLLAFLEAASRAAPPR